MSKYKFPCGCEFNVTDIKLSDGRPSIDFVAHQDNIDMKCTRTWDIISSGNTKGVFQLESQLGQSLARKLKPRNIEHLSALISIMRPGVLEAVRDKKSVTMHYIDRKNGEEEVSYFHPALKPALESTYGEMIYQEQAMQIARDVAGFTLQEADELRKAIGKKIPEAMAKVKTKFLEGSTKLGIVTDEEAIQIFDWIEKSQRYSFNKSHAVSYAYNGYISAYAKAHFPKAFFTSYLRYAKNKQRPFVEIHELVQNGRLMNTEICSPDFRMPFKHFRLIDKKIFFGFCDIKGVGESVYKKVLDATEKTQKKIQKSIAHWNWLEFLVFFSPLVPSTAIMAMINSGALSYMGLNRTEMGYEYNIYNQLSPKESKWVDSFLFSSQKVMSLKELLAQIIALPTGRQSACSSDKRKAVVQALYNTLCKPTYQLKDSPEWIASVEQSLLGIPLTCTSIEACDTSAANTTCIQFLNNQHPKTIIIAAQINSYNEIKVKNGKSKGQKMAFLKISDITGSVDNVVAFADVWPDINPIVFDGNNVLLHGEKSKDGNSLILKQIWQI